MARMRVTLVNRLAGIHAGGGEIYDLSLARALRGRGVEARLVTGRCLSRAPLPPPAGLPVRYVRTPYLGGAAHRLGRPGWRIQDLDLALFERGAERILAESRPCPDVAQITGMPRLARRLEERHGITTVLLFPGPPSPRHREAIMAAAAVAGVGAVTPYLREHFSREIHDMTAGVDPGLFRPGLPSVRRRMGLDPGTPVILYAGRLVPLKNIPMLVAAFAAVSSAVPAARMLVAGDGPLRSGLLAAAAAAGVAGRVHLAGEIPHTEMPAWYAAADLLLLTSENESFSLVALEAMACGVPVVAPRVGYLPSLIGEEGAGRIYPPGDLAACSAMIRELLEDREAARRAGQAARRRAEERHSWDKVAGEFESLYRKTLAA